MLVFSLIDFKILYHLNLVKKRIKSIKYKNESYLPHAKGSIPVKVLISCDRSNTSYIVHNGVVYCVFNIKSHIDWYSKIRTSLV